MRECAEAMLNQRRLELLDTNPGEWLRSIGAPRMVWAHYNKPAEVLPIIQAHTIILQGPNDQGARFEGATVLIHLWPRVMGGNPAARVRWIELSSLPEPTETTYAILTDPELLLLAYSGVGYVGPTLGRSLTHRWLQEMSTVLVTTDSQASRCNWMIPPDKNFGVQWIGSDAMPF